MLDGYELSEKGTKRLRELMDSSCHYSLPEYHASDIERDPHKSMRMLKGLGFKLPDDDSRS